MSAVGKDLFISHSSGDGEIARELKTVLEDAGYSVWMAPDDIVGARPWAEQIVDAIESTKAMLVLISSNANDSPYVSREVNLAFSHKRAVLPIRIEPVTPEASLELFLSLVQRVDAFPPPIANHRDRILKRLALTLQDAAPSDVRPPAPAPSPVPGPMPDAAAESTEVPSSSSRPADGGTAPSPPPAGPLGPGSRVGVFTIEAILGEGGMATVYRARQEEPSRLVALKVIRADHAADPAYRQRFLAEKDTLASLEHPSIVPIYAAGEANGVLYIAMRLVDGPDLAGRLKEAGHMSLADTVTTLGPIADAIDYAHEMGVVHRDLKPSNIVLDKRGRPYLMDFGLGKHIDKSSGLSAPGIAIGTLEYMAPEQFSGVVDPPFAGRIDVYALGCVAYACLAGTSPFKSESPERVMYAHLHAKAPSIGDERPDLPTAVSTVLQRALAKDPADRYESAHALMVALNAAAAVGDEETVPIVVPKTAGVGSRVGAWARANTAVAAALVAALAILSIGGGMLLTGSHSFHPGPTGTADVAIGLPTFVAGQPTTLATFAVPTDTPPAVTTGPTSVPVDTATPPPPGPTPDLDPPSGINVTIAGGGTVYSTTVNLSLKATGARTMRFGNASSASGDCSWGSWISYAPSYAGWKLSGATAGTKWVCAAFRDAALNPAYDRDSVYFDHRPVWNNSYPGNSSNTCTGDHTLDLLKSSPYIATDPDAGDTLRIAHAWTGGSTYPGTKSLDFAITNNATELSVHIDCTCPGGAFTITDWVTIADTHGATVSGSFKWSLPAC